MPDTINLPLLQVVGKNVDLGGHPPLDRPLT